NYVAVQALILLGFWFVPWAAAMIVHRPWKEPDASIRYLWWTSAVMFGVFWAFSLKTPEEPNWPITAYISGGILAAGWIARQLQAPILWYRRLAAASLASACLLGILVTAIMLRSELAQPVLLRISGRPSANHPLPMRRFDPTCRLRGWKYLGQEVDRIRDELRAKGIEPVVVGSGWTLPGELGFYCAGHPTVYSIGLALGDRWSQYDLWRPNPVLDPEAFRGRAFMIVGDDLSSGLFDDFDKVGDIREVEYREREHVVARWRVRIYYGFKTFFWDLPELKAARSY